MSRASTIFHPVSENFSPGRVRRPLERPTAPSSWMAFDAGLGIPTHVHPYFETFLTMSPGTYRDVVCLTQSL